MNIQTYIPTKYRLMTKAKKKFNTISHLESLSTQFLLDEMNSFSQQNRVLFPNWTISLNNIRFYEFDEVICKLPKNDTTFGLKSKIENEYSNIPISLSSYDSWSHVDKVGAPLGVSFESKNNHTDQVIVDIILNAGGPVWAIDWCPMKLTRAQQKKERQDCFIAVGANKSLNDLHAIGESYEGMNIIQIWNLGPLTTQGIQSQNKPYLALGIVHNKSCVWSLSWCPTGSSQKCDNDSNVPRLGLLAATFGDGSVSVYAVPNPNYLKKKQKFETIFIDIEPVFSTKLENIMIHSVKWSQKDDCELLATGCSNGYIAIWKLTDKSDTRVKSCCPISYDSGIDMKVETDELRCQEVNLNYVPVLYRKAHGGLIRNICWSPSDPYILATCSLSSSIKLWDVRFYSSPISVVPSQGGIVNTISWDRNNNMIVAGLDNGGIRLFTPDTTKKFEHHESFIWHTDTSPYLRFMASCDCDGKVVVYPLISDFNDSKNNRRVKGLEGFIEKSEITVNGMTELFTLSVSNECEIEENFENIDAKTQKKTTKEPVHKPKISNDEPIKFPDTKLSWNVVKWSPNISHPNWIAYGGNAGLVRIQIFRWIEPTMK